MCRPLAQILQTFGACVNMDVKSVESLRLGVQIIDSRHLFLG